MSARRTARDGGQAARISPEAELESKPELRRLTDDARDGYVAWREQSAAVAVTYANWLHAAPSDHAVAFAAYLAALDQEEEAASQYERLLELMTRGLRDHEPN